MIKINYSNVLSIVFSFLSNIVDSNEISLSLPILGITLKSKMLRNSLDALSSSFENDGIININKKNQRKIQESIIKAAKQTFKKNNGRSNRKLVKQFSYEVSENLRINKDSLSIEELLEMSANKLDSPEKEIIISNMLDIVCTFIEELSNDSEVSDYVELKLLLEIKKHIFSLSDANYTFSKYVSSCIREYQRQNIIDNEFTEFKNIPINLVPFVGMDKEIESLNLFLDHSDSFSWWALTGQAGSGKSRLANHFLQLEYKNWVKVLLPSNFFVGEEFKKYKPYNYSSNLLMIIDEVTDAITTGNFLRDLQFTLFDRKYKIRILYISREAIGGHNPISPSWYQLVTQTGKKNIETPRMYKETTLNLDGLSMDSNRAIMNNLLSSLTSKELSISIQNKLLDKINSLDYPLARPLYTIFIIYAYSNGNDVFKWGKNDMFDWIMEREIEYTKDRLKINSIHHKSVIAWRHIYSYVTGIKSLQADIDSVPPFLHDHFITLQERANDLGIGLIDLIDCDIFFDELGRKTYYLKPIKPDIVGEYYVIYDFKHSSDKYKTEFLKELWSNIDNNNYLRKCLHSFHGNPLLTIDCLLRSPDVGGRSCTDNDWVAYAWLLQNAMFTGNDDESKILETLKVIAVNKDTQDIWVAYVGAIHDSIVNLSELKETELKRFQKISNIDKVELIDKWTVYDNNLYEHEFNDVELDMSSRMQKLEQMNALAVKKDIDLLWVLYANALRLLMHAQLDKTMLVQLWDRLRILSYEQDILTIHLSYAQGLLVLIHKEIEELDFAFNELENLTIKTDFIDIWIIYTQGLIWLLEICEDEAKRNNIFEQVRDLAKLKNNDDIWNIYAEGLVTLSYKYAIEKNAIKVNDTVDCLFDLAQARETVWAHYASSLINQSVLHGKEKNLESLEITTRKLLKLAKEKRHTSYWLAYSTSLLNKTLVLDDIEKSMNVALEIKRLAEEHDKNSFWIGYAQALFNISNISTGVPGQLKLGINKQLEIVKYIESIAKEKDIIEIWISYADILVNISTLQKTAEERELIVINIQKLAEEKDNDKIWLAYANGLYSLSFLQNEMKDLQCTKEKIYQLAKKTMDINFLVQYSECLVNVTLLALNLGKQDILTITVEELSTLSREHSSNKIHLTYVRGLFNLFVYFVNKENTHSAGESFEKIKKIAYQSDMDNIWLIYIEVLYVLFRCVSETCAEWKEIATEAKTIQSRKSHIPDILVYYAALLIVGNRFFKINDQNWTDELLRIEIDMNSLLKKYPNIRYHKCYSHLLRAQTF